MARVRTPLAAALGAALLAVSVCAAASDVRDARETARDARDAARPRQASCAAGETPVLVRVRSMTSSGLHLEVVDARDGKSRRDMDIPSSAVRDFDKYQPGALVCDRFDSRKSK